MYTLTNFFLALNQNSWFQKKSSIKSLIQRKILMTRLYQSSLLFTGQNLTLGSQQTHYLRHVLRCTIGYQLTVFNEREGEWSAIITSLAKTGIRITVGEQIRIAVLCPNVTLIFALLKHDPLTFLLEKATELGVRRLCPVTTERCNISRLNSDRLLSTLVDATQQCERFDVPELSPLMALDKALASWDPEVPLFVCQERGQAMAIGKALQSLVPQSPAGFAFGPEGGFSPHEMERLHQIPFVRFISLGSRILRAETAALMALACYQALIGEELQ
jgi:16S rRNA (uracil1498-N3)-methyltransferase